ncbi:MAG: FAD-dependent oxidoreductase [Gammaproteobacteria bacterium]|nr:FAD-dependent oxidoreductase [Gammaproteobacteria bacterium]
MTNQFDLIVIGGGSGGIAAARRAAEYGARVLLFERGRLGGTCVNVGCVPKKVMWNAAQIRHALALARDYGFDLDARGLDWAALKRGRDDYVARLNRIYADNLEAAGVRVMRGDAALCGGDGGGGGDSDNGGDGGDGDNGDRGNGGKIAVESGGETHRAAHILIAAGGAPVLPEIPGAHLGITSDGFFELEAQPQRPLIIGAGYIATELAGALHGLGSAVTLLLRKDRLLRAFDPVLGDTVLARMHSSGVDIRAGLQCRAIFRAPDGGLGYRADATETHAGAPVEDAGFDCVLFAISRAPDTAALRLDRAGIRVDAGGFIPVDEFQNTAAAGVYALGDITAAPALTPVAIAAGRRLADRLFGGQARAKLELDNIPTVVFSEPPAGSVGLSEAQAVAAHGRAQVKIYTSRFVNMRYALGADKPPSVVKLITAGAREVVVGCHVVGDGADEMLQGFAVALKMRATKADFDRTVAIHPTAAEEVVTLR